MPSIFVGNLPYNAAEADLRHVFEPYGRVTSVRIMSDRETNRARGFAFVQMPSLDDADEAINKLAGQTLGGRRLTITESSDDRRDAVAAPKENPDRKAALAMFDALLSD
jgi:RNA recognition motif-containing protein